MDIFFYILSALFAVSTAIVGTVMKFRAPKKINNWWGFSTKVSRSSQATWDYAQSLCSKVLLIFSAFSILFFVVLVIATAKHICPFLANKVHILTIITLVVTIIGVIITLVTVQIKTKKFVEKKNIKEN